MSEVVSEITYEKNPGTKECRGAVTEKVQGLTEK